MGLDLNRNNNIRPFINPHPPSLARVFNRFSISGFRLEKKNAFTIANHAFGCVYSIPITSADQNSSPVPRVGQNF